MTNNMVKTHPEVIKYWDYSRNAIEPESLVSGSGRLVWWYCKSCGYGWKDRVCDVTSKKERGCRPCLGLKVTKNRNFAVQFPEILKDFDLSINTVSPYKVHVRSGEYFYWECHKCGHKSKKKMNYTVKNRFQCQGCIGAVATEFNNLKNSSPFIENFWDYTKNSGLGPENFTPKSSKIVHLKCPTCTHLWQSSGDKISKYKTECAECKSLKVRFPRLYKTLDTELNAKYNISVECLSSKSGKDAWWKCPDCNSSWKSRIINRTLNDSGCPFCSRKPISKVSQKWLDTEGVLLENREYYIKSLRLTVDGIDPETNTVYEFLGDFWHGNTNNPRFPSEGINSFSKKTYGQLYKNTFKRIDRIKSAGYRVVYIWEGDVKERA